MRADRDMAGRIRDKMEYSAGGLLRDRMWGDILATYRQLQPETTPAHRRVRRWEVVTKSRPMGFAAAAVVLAAVFLLARYLIGTEGTRPPEPPPTITAQRDEKPVKPTRIVPRSDEELETAKLLFARHDLAGLVQLLQTGQPATKIQVAEYLGQIGDDSVLPALQTLAAQWQGPREDNPFLRAVEAIQQRRGPSEPEATVSGRKPDGIPAERSGTPQPQIASPPAQLEITGTITDRDTSRPIGGAVVHLGSAAKPLTTTDAAGRFRLLDDGPYPQRMVYAAAPDYVGRRILVHTDGGGTREVAIELSRGSSKVAGTVTDPAGRPVADVKAEVSGQSYHSLPTVTDAKGQFEFDGLDPAGRLYRLEVTHPMYLRVSVDIEPAPAGQTRHQDIMLKPGIAVFGRVTDPQGAPVAAATVGNGKYGSALRVETDERGMYRLGAVEPGEVVLWAIHEQYAPYVEHTTLEKGRAEHRIDVQLRSPRVLRGRVVDSDGNPVPQASVNISEYNGVHADRQWQACDPNGHFTIPNAPPEGELSLGVAGDGIVGKTEKVDLSHDECLIAVTRSGRIYAGVVDAATGAPVRRFLVKMTSSRTGPFAGGYVSWWEDEGQTFDSPGGLFDTGREDLSIGARYRMTVCAKGYTPRTLDPVVAQAVTEDPNRTVFELRPAAVFAGRVVAVDGRPVEAATVTFLSSETVRDDPVHWPRAVTNEAGVYTISGLGPEPQCVLVRAHGFGPRAFPVEDVLEAPGRLADITLDTAATVVGRVLDESGAGIADARVDATVRVGLIMRILKMYPNVGPSTRTDKNGYYELTDVPTGHVGIYVRSTDSSAQKNVDLQPGATVEVNFGREPGYVVSGVIRFGDSTLKNAEIRLHAKTARTDQEGRFQIGGLPEGLSTFSVAWYPNFVTDPAQRPTDRTLNLNRPLGISIDMELNIDLGAGSFGIIGGGSVNGIVPQLFRSREDLSVATRRQWTSGSDVEAPEQWQSAGIPSAQVKTDGQFTIEGLSPGRYYLILSGSEGILAISDTFVMIESGRIDAIRFHHADRQLLIRVLDAGTGQPVPDARFSLTNHLNTNFSTTRYAAEQSLHIMITQEDGQRLYDGLPAGAYQVRAQGYGYFPGRSAWTDLTPERPAEAIVRLDPAAVVRFDLANALRQQIADGRVLVRCTITPIAGQDAARLKDRAIEPHARCFMRVVDSEPIYDIDSVLHLPDGTFNIEYAAHILDPGPGALINLAKPVAQGTASATCRAGKVTVILISER